MRFQSLTKIQVLSCSANELLRTIREMILREAGREVVNSSSKAHALELIQRESFDVLLLGHSLSDSSLDSLCDGFRRRFPSGRVVLVSGGEDRSCRHSLILARRDLPPASTWLIFFKSTAGPSPLSTRHSAHARVSSETGLAETKIIGTCPLCRFIACETIPPSMSGIAKSRSTRSTSLLAKRCNASWLDQRRTSDVETARNFIWKPDATANAWPLSSKLARGYNLQSSPHF